MAALREILSFLLIPFTIVIVIFTTIGFLATRISPIELGITSFAGLLLPISLFIDLILCLYWGVRKKGWIILPIGAILLNIGYITAIFRYSTTEFQESKGEKIKIVTYNVFGFQCTSSKLFQREIAEFLEKENADIVCFQEYCETRCIDRDSMKTLLKFMPYQVLFRTSGKADIPYGVAIFSRYPIIRAEAIPFNSKVNGAGWCDLRLPEDTIRLFNLHLQTTHFNQKIRKYLNLRTLGHEKEAVNNSINVLQENFKRRALQTEKVRRIIDTTRYPVIICGDFNDTPGSYTYHHLKGKYKDGFKEAGEGYAYTFQGIKQLLRIDYIIYSKEFRGISYKSPSLVWSDHNPVLMDIVYLPPISEIQ